MIPPFNESSYLPPGIHPATLDEIEARFGRRSKIRRDQMESVRWMVDLARRAGVQRIVLNGSFVTDIIEPNDVDCVLLFGRGLRDVAAFMELRAVLPYLHKALAGQRNFQSMTRQVFAYDRYGNPKGMVEVTL